MSQHAGENGSAFEIEPAPVMSVEIAINNSVTHFTPRPDGGMVIHFTAIQQTGPNQYGYIGQQYSVSFSPGGWENFKKQVAMDGRKSKVVIAGAMPTDISPQG